MATRSTIALEFADDTVGQVYCHWDGYLSHNGTILSENYSDPFKLRDLIDLGDLSVLAPEIGTKHDFEARVEGVCTFYGRDRDESDTQAKYFDNFEDYAANHQTEEYEYILRKDGQWYVDQGNGFELLSEVLVKEAA
jgi:hypothetical protein